MPGVNYQSSLETDLQTQTTLFPTLRYLVQLLPLDHRRVSKQLQQEAERNPFLRYQKNPSQSDILPDWYTPQATSNLQEHLQGQIAVLQLPSRQREALLYLTQSLSTSGYLEESPQVWAKGSSFSVKELEAVIPQLQSLDPPGIGACSLQECLLLQLQDQPESLATLLVKDYLEEVAACVENSTQVEKLLQKLRQIKPEIDLESLKTAIRFVQTLEPRPARNFNHNPALTVIPDLKVEPQSNGWQVVLAYEVNRDFCLDEEAVILVQKSTRQKETQKLQALLQKAQYLLTALNQWQENLLKVGEFLVTRQQTFLSSGNQLDLVPTSQQMVAATVGLSDATISRIVRERYLLIDGQTSQIIPLQHLCTSTCVGGRTPQQIQQLLLQLIQQEPPDKPYTDHQLSRLIEIRFGLPIARRTVTKYRLIAGIDSSNRRQCAFNERY